jgi:cyclopropane-fatty-acyl-phospholipid synthase
VSLSNTAPLRRELGAAIRERPFAVEFWDGTALAATTTGAPTFSFRSPKAIAHILRAPGELGLGRAYVAGLLDVDDMEGALRVVDTWEPPPLGAGQKARLALALVRASGLVVPPKAPVTELRLRGQRHTRARDARAVRHHYDAGNDFFALFLDESMTYSCAIFSRGAETLEEAQETKLELVATKLGLEQGMRVLDVGCGWGSFALHAATRHGAQVVGITLSPQQAELARRRVREAGLEDSVDIRIADYREIEGEQFDAIASIGMVEHVGEERIDLYAERLATLLRPGGRLLNHGIAKLMHDGGEDGPFSDRYVFPDGHPIHLSRVLLALERAGFVVEHVEGFAADYARTVREWWQRFERRLDEATRLAGPERVRTWVLYLHAARMGFETGEVSVYQVRCTRPKAERPTSDEALKPSRLQRLEVDVAA